MIYNLWRRKYHQREPPSPNNGIVDCTVRRNQKNTGNRWLIALLIRHEKQQFPRTWSHTSHRHRSATPRRDGAARSATCARRRSRRPGVPGLARWELVEERGGHGMESWSNSRLAAAIRALAVVEAEAARRERGVAPDPGLARERQQRATRRRRCPRMSAKRGHGRGPVRHAARLQRGLATDSCGIRHIPFRSSSSGDNKTYISTAYACTTLSTHLVPKNKMIRKHNNNSAITAMQASWSEAGCTNLFERWSPSDRKIIGWVPLGRSSVGPQVCYPNGW